MKQRVLAVGVPALGLLMWFLRDNGHGLVAVYGFALTVLIWAARRLMRRPAQVG
ncbi:hypothetical protein AB0L53_47445 [Nonomuraea sp. NPDC052129]|uniref:hypothetical protein n=1 Tax=Nonomuraea sp. NPDC052129 TaxID=3154651 RepID=UPI00343A1F52